MYKEKVIPIIPVHKSVAIIIMALICLVGVATIQPAKANPQFIISSWEYPDEYGQGINLFAFYENSTGAWVEYGDAYEPDQSYIVNWNTSGSIKLRCYAFLNSTLTGAIDEDDGKNYLRHNVTVTSAGQSIFSQSNFTYYNFADILDPMWYYGYEVVLNFLPLEGQVYIVTVTYEVFY